MKQMLKRLLPLFLWKCLINIRYSPWTYKTLYEMGVQNLLGRMGYNISRKSDFYSPLPSISQLNKNLKRWDRPSPLKGIEYDVGAMKNHLLELLSSYFDEFSSIPDYKELQKVGFGPGYTSVDALVLYMMIRHIKPKRYIEVGSGLSTYCCHLAAKQNANEGHPVEVTCIEPYPYEGLYSIPDINIISKEVQENDVSFFKRLEENDVLFIDSSHIVKVDGDVPFLFLEVLPTINKGVTIHIHDIPFPYNSPYPSKYWVLNRTWPYFWNEAMLLQAFLCMNKQFGITMSAPLLRHLDERFLKKNIPIYESIDQNPNTFSSIWLKRISA